jgi:O-methyltransferase
MRLRTSRGSMSYKAKCLLLNAPVRTLSRNNYKYEFMFSPMQLGFLCEQLGQTAGVAGSVLEVGCAYGATTVYLNRHMDDKGIDADYFAIDTFNGFTKKDISAEAELGRVFRYEEEFRQNSKSIYDRTMRRNGVGRVVSFRADASDFDYKQLAPFRFVLVDVDLYRPVLAVLNSVYDLVTPGGRIIIDDCANEGRWAGGYDAFNEFADAAGLEATVFCDKLGLIVKSE